MEVVKQEAVTAQRHHDIGLADRDKIITLSQRRSRCFRNIGFGHQQSEAWFNHQ
jgi:hypothetical protein